MNSFYVSMIFIGIILILVSLIWVAFEKKSSFSLLNRMEEKKQDMVSIISDAEQMIEELNKFSDYMVMQMDAKNEELNANLKKADEEINQLRGRIAGQMIEVTETTEIIETKKTAEEVDLQLSKKNVKKVKKEAASAKVVNGNTLEEVQNKAEQLDKQNSDLIIESEAYEEIISDANQYKRQYSRKNDKIIPINSRYKEVIRLSNDGLNDTEIAKRLNMGKGEIQLVMELNKL